MAENIVTSFSFDPTDAPQKVGSVRTEMRQLKEAMLTLSQDDPRWPAVFARYTELTSKVRELNRVTRAADPREAVKNYSRLAEAGVGAFTALRGAANLFGITNEETLKKIQDVESAMAVLRGLKAFDEGLRTAKAMYAALKATNAAARAGAIASKALGAGQQVSAEGTRAATIATRGFGLALKAIGIGLVITAIAYLVDNWKELKAQFAGILPNMDSVSGSFDKFKQIAVGVGSVVINLVVTPIKLLISGVQTAIKVFEDVKSGHWGQIFTDIGQGVKDGVKIVADGLNFVKNFQEGEASSAAAQAAERRKKELEELIKHEEDKVKVMEAGGQDSYKVSLDIIKKKKELYADDKEKLNEVLQDELILHAEHNKMLREEAEKAAEKAAELEKKYQEDQERIREEHAKRLEKTAEDEKEELEKSAAEALKLQTEFLEKGAEIDQNVNQKKLDKLEKEYLEVREKSKGNYSALIELELSYEKQKAAIQKDIDDKAKAEQQKKYEAYIKSIEAQDQILLKSEKQNFKEKIAALKASDAQIEALLKQGVLNEKTALDAKKVNAQIEIELNKQVAEAKKAEVSAIGGALNALSGIVSKNSVAGKAIAVGQATINTYQGATLALASAPPPYSYIEAAAITAAGLANVKKIISTKVGAGDQGGSVPGSGGAQLQFNAPSVAAPANTTNLSQSSISALANANGQSSQVYVSESDISSVQATVSQARQAGTLN